MVKATRHDIRKYPDMKLYQEILLLQHFFKGRWVVENVKPYYKPLIKPSIEIGRHLIWSNFDIMPMRNHKAFPNFIRDDTQSGVERLKKWLGIEYDGNIYYEGNHSPGQVLRNCVHPEIGKHVFNESMREGLFSISDFQTGGKNLKTD
jgi:DNA (cytosine-5)-methyltransferase 1